MRTGYEYYISTYMDSSVSPPRVFRRWQYDGGGSEVAGDEILIKEVGN